ncbi:teichoic acid ABC transporter permease [Staphylococcus felis]|uniref:Transport permease protein n=1 Tax=Staphylococcus felis TaxID=46127 RepID=A0A3E0ILJ2_9STAP|nr:ABC transporter permease [Staphylococcus felis]REH85818.1 teichoic acid ABC transporter permease [Staphylococcus felis]REH88089.1 teichoic acid ABC transporter permease [Staphylococcus felis]REH89542.1 teichoic acid ABC transporter permease [Staphylococcus felis]REH90593.1 teichoic acid ABC transporter permease [Staphylococcus felis]REI09941.1 teichoic acid ABC transporter permease [Staphylococcus felis]
MKSIMTVLTEHVKSFYLIQRLAQFQLKITNHNNYLGLAWEIINPIIQIMVYWFVFGFGIRSNTPVEGIPFIYWLLVGISMWFFINQGILEGTKSITMKYGQVAKMNFPLSIIPTYIVTSKLYGHLVLVGAIILLCTLFGIMPSIHIIQLVLYVPFAFIFTASVTLLTSTLGVLVRDTQMAMQALLRVLFYMSPILWNPPEGSLAEKVLMFNPIYFIAESYRAAILFKEWYFIEHWELALYNVAVVILFFVVGSMLHMRYRDHFADFM